MDPRYNPQLKNLRTISPDTIRPPPGLRETADNTFGPHRHTIHNNEVPPSEYLPPPERRQITSVKPAPTQPRRTRIISVKPAPPRIAPTPPRRKRIISVKPAPPQNTSVQSTTKKKRIISVKPAPPRSQKNKSNGGQRRIRKSLINKKKFSKLKNIY
jgi:hypothetical protein